MARIDFWGSEATADFERALCGDGQPLDWRISWDRDRYEGLKGKADLARSPKPPPSGKTSGPTRPGDQLRRVQPTDSNTDQLASPTWVAGGSLRADGRAPLAWGALPQQR